jgi:hypothetical protein
MSCIGEKCRFMRHEVPRKTVIVDELTHFPSPHSRHSDGQRAEFQAVLGAQRLVRPFPDARFPNHHREIPAPELDLRPPFDKHRAPLATTSNPLPPNRPHLRGHKHRTRTRRAPRQSQFAGDLRVVMSEHRIFPRVFWIPPRSKRQKRPKVPTPPNVLLIAWYPCPANALNRTFSERANF